MVRSAHLAVGGLQLISLISAADASHYWYHHTDNLGDYPARERDPRFSESRSGSALGLVMAQLTRACVREVDELRNFPVETVARTIRIAGEQRAVLENIRRTADDTANTLAANCPSEVAPAPSARLDALNGSLDAVETAFNALQPLLDSLYLSLSDEQRAALVGRSTDRSSDTSRAVKTSGLSTRSRTYRGFDRETSQIRGDRD
jgi:hypothetical protein